MSTKNVRKTVINRILTTIDLSLSLSDFIKKLEKLYGQKSLYLLLHICVFQFDFRK